MSSCLCGQARSCFPMELCHGAPASSIFPITLCHSAAILFAMALPTIRSATAPLPGTLPHQRPGQPHLPDGFPSRRPGQQYLPDSSLPQCRHPLCHGTPGHPLCLGAPASNKPHPAEKSTPVWLAIWRTWAGFANSQHRDSTFATPDNICAHSSLLPRRACCSDRRKSVGPSAPIAYATSVSPPDEAAAWPWAQVSGGK